MSKSCMPERVNVVENVPVAEDLGDRLDRRGLGASNASSIRRGAEPPNTPVPSCVLAWNQLGLSKDG